MSEELILKIDKLIEENVQNLVDDTIRLINIKSVKGEPLPGAPFGEGPKKVFEEVEKMSDEAGFYFKDYNVGVISLALKDKEPDLGIWLHGDVVPEGTGWNFEPYNGKEYNGYIIGRGASDNKGQLSAIYNLFKIFKQLNVPLNYNPAIYVGSNEETGKADLKGLTGNNDAKGFLNVCKTPKLSLVPDGSFPVGYGGKGGAVITLQSKKPLSNFTLTAGLDATPGEAVAVFDKGVEFPTLSECTITKGEETKVSTFSPPRHGASPDPNGNMITKISKALIDTDVISADDKRTLEFLKLVSLDVKGEFLGIKTSHEQLGELTVFSKKAESVDGFVQLMINVRFPLGITADEILENVAKKGSEYGFEIFTKAIGDGAYMVNPDSEVAKELTKISNEVTKDNDKPYTMAGGTYAHVLPNAYVFGTDANIAPADFPEDRGSVHSVDESASIERLKRAMRIYARALIKLNDIDWFN